MLLSLLFINNNNVLPPINNIYYTNINIPLIGKQDVTYQRIENLKSVIKLSGKINQNGYIYYDMNNPYKYTLDDKLKYIINKYRCSIDNPIYYTNSDIIELKIKINLINYTKKIIFNNLNL
jgi:hypothetical protein